MPSGWPRRALTWTAGALAVALAARISVTIPGTEVPQSAQTLAVVVVAALLGAGDGTPSMVLYVLVGALGVPVFADGGAGWAHLTGPTGGYLLGFVVAAALVGALADRGILRRPGVAAAVMVGAHAVILGLGWSRLAWSLGPGEAFRQGIVPFAPGGVVKGLLGAAIVVGVERAGRMRAPVQRSG